MQLQLIHQHGSARLLIIMGVVHSFLVQSKTVQDPVLQPTPGLQYLSLRLAVIATKPGRPSTMINLVFISNPLQVSKMIAASSYSVGAD